jgi:hypothetical protein
MFCPECGFDADEARFCATCGTNLDQFRAADPGREPEDEDLEYGDFEEEALEDEDFEAHDDDDWPEEEVVEVPRAPEPRTGSRGRTQRPSRQARRQQSLAARSGAHRTTRPVVRSSRLSPAVVWMTFAAVAAVVIIGAFALIRTPSDAAGGATAGAQPAGPIAADTSGSYTVLVQRANGLYDQGAQALQKNQQSTSAQFFTAAAKVYRAAWKKQSGDPNVGTDYATSLFYSGDTDAALKQVDIVLAKSPDFQTAHLNKGIYLETAAQVAQQSGKQTKSQSLLAKAKAEFEKAVSIDPTSSAGQKAAEDLKSF